MPAYNCVTNTTVNDTNCATSPGGQTFSEGASEYSYPTCTYGRQSALVRQVCGQGLFAANDPGFLESVDCSPGTGVPEAPWAAALVLLVVVMLLNFGIRLVTGKRLVLAAQAE